MPPRRGKSLPCFDKDWLLLKQVHSSGGRELLESIHPATSLPALALRVLSAWRKLTYLLMSPSFSTNFR